MIAKCAIRESFRPSQVVCWRSGPRIIMGISVIKTVWFYAWIDTLSGFRLVLVAPYAALVNILICRVFRNTKLGLYNKVPVQSNGKSDLEMQTGPTGIVRWNSEHNDNHDATDADSETVMPIQIAVSKVVEQKTDYPPLTSSKHGKYLDFGMLWKYLDRYIQTWQLWY